MAAQKSETIIRELLAMAGVEPNGKNPWDIQVHDPRFYDRVLRYSSLGLGEAYVDGWWDAEEVDELICRLLLADLDVKVRGNWRIALHTVRSNAGAAR